MPRNQADYDRGIALQKKLRGALPASAGRSTIARRGVDWLAS